MHIHTNLTAIIQVTGVTCLQRFDAVSWASGREYGLQNFSDEVAAWLSV